MATTNSVKRPGGLRALTIKPPWAWAIAHAGKRIENRSWTTKYRGPLVIHSGIGLKAADVASLERILGKRVDPKRFHLGAIVATATLADVLPLEACADRWAIGPYCWILKDIRPLAEPIPVLGSLGLWDPRARLSSAKAKALGKHLSNARRSRKPPAVAR
jgi:hypothetical protein